MFTTKSQGPARQVSGTVLKIKTCLNLASPKTGGRSFKGWLPPPHEIVECFHAPKVIRKPSQTCPSCQLAQAPDDHTVAQATPGSAPSSESLGCWLLLFRHSKVLVNTYLYMGLIGFIGGLHVG